MNHKSILPPLRYPGGKFRARKKLAGMVPEGVMEYREPFFGGGSLFFYLKQIYRSRWTWRVADVCPYLMNFWQHMRSDPYRLHSGATVIRRSAKDGRALYDEMRRQVELFGIEGAIAYYVLNRITFSGSTMVGGLSMDAFENRFSERRINDIVPASELLSDVRMECADYEDMFGGRRDSRIFLFLDPPYTVNRHMNLYGKRGLLHRRFDFVRFAEAVKGIRHNWLMTIDDSPQVRKAFEGYRIMTTRMVYGMRNVRLDSSQIQQELIISNYNDNGTRIK